MSFRINRTPSSQTKISGENMFFLHNEYQIILKRYFLVLIGLFACVLLVGNTIQAAGTASNQIIGIDSQKTADGLIIRITTAEEPTYTVYELFNPTRVVVDIADAALAENVSTTLPKNQTAALSTSFLSGNDPVLTRFEFTFTGAEVSYKVKTKDNNLSITLKSSQAKAVSSAAPGGSGKAKKQAGSATEITDIKISTTKTETRVSLLADGNIADYSYNVLDSRGGQPARLYIDLHKISGRTLLREQQVGTSLSKIRVANRGSGIRVVFDSDLKEIFPYDILNKKDRLEVVIKEKGSVGNPPEKKKKTPMVATQSAPEATSKLPEIQETKSSIKDSFSFSGYNKQRITVDFFKIDLHNVFRLFKEISNVNIVVDESVSGSLTLALDNVPWDFALDIILNLKDLQKEERHNTIVILPKDKKFNWPEQTATNLSFEADEEVAAEEAIVIRQKQSLSPKLVAAKKLIQQGREFEKREEYDKAINNYVQGFTNWPDNSQLANRIATLFLVHLRHNAKAVHYAKKALKIDPKNSSAALNAAIALANMQKPEEAGQFFDQSVSGKKPSRAALQSYAVYCEETKKYDAAIKLLKKHDAVYGETLDSMISLARIYDKKGSKEMSTKIYKSILVSGFRVPPDLKKYIQGRIAMK